MIALNRTNVLTAVALGIVFFAAAYYFTISSAAYKEARIFIESSPEVNAKIGKVRDISLSGKSTSKVDRTGSVANYNFSVVGELDRGKVEIDLIEENGAWVVRHASLTAENDGLVIDLKPTKP